MNRRIAIVSATEKEIAPLLNHLRTHAEEHSFQTFQYHGLLIDILYSGIGIMQTALTLMEYISHRHPNGWIQMGIGGAFDPSLRIGEVYQIQSEMLTGFGAEDRDGRIMDPFELGWNDPDGFPFTNGKLECSYRSPYPLTTATGMTTFHSSGHQLHIDQMRSKQHGQIENMEGAPFFYISLIKRIPFLSIRSISNMVEPRDTGKWKMESAIQNLNDAVLHIFEESKLNPDKLFRNSAG